MLIEVHHGDGCVLLVNGNSRSIHLLDYIRSRCSLPASIKLDLCLITTGEPFRLESTDSKLLLSERRRLPSHIHCILVQIDEEGTYIPLLNDPTVITSEFLAKLKRATNPRENSSKLFGKSGRQSTYLPDEQLKRHRSLRSLAIAATINKLNL